MIDRTWRPVQGEVNELATSHPLFERDWTNKMLIIGLTRGGKMYKRILLAYDGSVEGRTALRQGALLARQCGAKVFLLSVLADDGTFLLAEVALAGASVRIENDFTAILNEGVARLKKLGLRSCGQTG